ncbi:MAG: hypothetical protein KatS3mg076_0724 [Candidatus Binatia bacterium]|nr:MAG: hypothetical protein KatS3mg076_0724 [Candidatus Binatia bacterium]
MPSEKAKENKTLVAPCAACGRILSTELLVGIVLRRDGKRELVAVCEDCRSKGWEPPAPR